MSNQDNEKSTGIGKDLANKPVELAKKGRSARGFLKGAKVAVLFIKKLLTSLIGWLATLLGPYLLIILIIIILLLLVLESVKMFDLFQESNSRTEAAVIFDESVKTVMEDYLNEGPQVAKETIRETQTESPYPPISEAWLQHAATLLKQSIAVPTIHHYFKNIENDNYKPWHRDYEKDNASNPDALKSKYERIISKEFAYYFNSMVYEPEFTWTQPPEEEYIETVTTTYCTHTDEEGNTTTSVSGPTTSKKVLPKRDIVETVTVGYTKGIPAYTTTKTVSHSSHSSGDCSSDVQTTTVLYVLDEGVPLPVEFLPVELIKALILDAPEGKRTHLVQVQDLEYSIDLGKEIDPSFPRPDIEYTKLKKCVQAKNSNIVECITKHVSGGTFAFGFGGAISGNWYPQEYEALYKKYAEMAGIDWFILAAVHGQETTFSTNPVATDPKKGSYNKRGELVGAVGHFQFMPATWVGWASARDFNVTSKGAIRGDISFIKVPANIKKYGGLGKDANNDGVADPWHIEDSMYAAALYIKSYGYISGNENAIKTALAKYNGGPTYYVSNDAQKYAADVYANGKRYEAGPVQAAPIPVSSGALTAPTVGRLTSGFGIRSIKLYNNEVKMHYGTDIANSQGTPIVSVADGVVVKALYHAKWGNYVQIQHNVEGREFRTLYAHLSRIRVSVGQSVTKGQLIGDMGATGSADGSHLHIELWMPPYRYPSSLVNPTTLIPMP